MLHVFALFIILFGCAHPFVRDAFQWKPVQEINKHFNRKIANEYVEKTEKLSLRCCVFQIARLIGCYQQSTTISMPLDASPVDDVNVWFHEFELNAHLLLHSLATWICQKRWFNGRSTGCSLFDAKVFRSSTHATKREIKNAFACNISIIRHYQSKTKFYFRANTFSHRRYLHCITEFDSGDFSFFFF